jgi:hypothetical protein
MQQVMVDIIDRDWSPPARPADCEFDYGQGISLAPGEQAQFMCAGDTAFGADEVLPYGESITAGALQCDSAEGGITCPILGQPTASRFHGRRTGCSDLAGSGDRRDLCGYTLVDYRRPSRRATMSFVARGCSAVGSASPCQGEGRGFESRHPLEGAMASTQRWSGRVVRQRPAKPCTRVRFPSPPPRKIPRG